MIIKFSSTLDGLVWVILKTGSIDKLINPWEMWMLFYKLIIQTDFTTLYLDCFLWKWSWVSAMENNTIAQIAPMNCQTAIPNN